MIPDHLLIQPGQEDLKPEQEAEAECFAQAQIQAHLSTEPADEAEAEVWLRQAYQVAGLLPPAQITWLEGSLHLAEQLGSPDEQDRIGYRVSDTVRAWVQEEVQDRVPEGVRDRLFGLVAFRVGTSVWQRVGKVVEARLGSFDVGSVAWVTGRASWEATDLAYFSFFDRYLTPNQLHAFAHFNELVSGYLLEKERALLVRRPHVLARDALGRLHSTTSRCLEYRDGWGISAWHGVEVPERFILAPERLSRQDFLNEPNVEVRRVIQERMGDRFVGELGGQVIDVSPRGTLYEVRLPEDDPEEVARYVQVPNAFTERRYFLRVPPTIQTADEAVAWTFQFGADDYRPAQET